MSSTHSTDFDVLMNDTSMEFYAADISTEGGKRTIIFTLKDKIGSLVEALEIFQVHGINLSRIESRPSKNNLSCYEILVECAEKEPLNKTGSLANLFKYRCDDVDLEKRNLLQKLEYIPWFPQKISELDQFAHRILSYGTELDSEHAGFTDQVYRERRKFFADIAFNYRFGEKIPRIEYTQQDISTWRTVYNELVSLYLTHACADQFLYDLIARSQRSQSYFLGELGEFRISVAQRLYWFTIEYGLCLQNGQRKAYGAGLLSSFGELQYALSDKPIVEPFEPNVCSISKYPISEYQPRYFLAESFASATNKLKTWTATIDRPFHVCYNAYNQRVEVLDKIEALQRLAREIESDMAILEEALETTQL